MQNVLGADLLNPLAALTPGLGALGDLWTACCGTSDTVSYRDVVQTVRVATRTPNKPGVSLG